MALPDTDLQIHQNVLDELRHDVRIGVTSLRVDVAGGVVHLRGTVPTDTQKTIAGDVAQRTKGVVGVRNDLAVGHLPPSDYEVRATVRASLFRDVRITGPNNIDVAVSGGVVTLAGTVPTDEQRADAVGDARTVPGVVSVVDKLTVSPCPTARIVPRRVLMTQSVTIYVPTPGSAFAKTVPPGAGIVGAPTETDPRRVCVDYDGKQHSGPTPKTWADHLFYAAAEYLHGIKTSAQNVVPSDEVTPVGIWDPDTRAVTLADPEPVQRWLGPNADLVQEMRTTI